MRSMKTENESFEHNQTEFHLATPRQTGEAKQNTESKLPRLNCPVIVGFSTKFVELVRG